MPTRRNNRRRGYVLVMTLGLLVLSATLLVAVARVSVRHALDAREAQTRLQRRWGAISARQAVLPYAERILAQAEARQHRPLPVLPVTLRLGREQFTLVLCDEQAKANVNVLLEMERGDRSAAESRIRQSLSGTGLTNMIRLRPISLPARAKPPKSAATQPAVQQWITGLGQMFENVPPERLLKGGDSAPANRLTCWGPGGINIMRAPERALVLATGSSLSQLDAGRLIEARNKHYQRRTSGTGEISAQPKTAQPPPASSDPVAAMLAEAKITLKDRARLPLVVGSTCHSLWVIIGDNQRASYSLTVVDDSNAQHTRTEAFVW